MGALWAFVGVAALVIVTPGPDTALTVRNALLGGRGAGVATAAGGRAGLAVWAGARRRPPRPAPPPSSPSAPSRSCTPGAGAGARRARAPGRASDRARRGARACS